MKYWWTIALGVLLNTTQVFYLHHRWTQAQEQKWIAATLAAEQERERLKAAYLKAEAAKREAEARRKAEENACAECLAALAIGAATAAVDGGTGLAIATGAVAAGSGPCTRCIKTL